MVRIIAAGDLHIPHRADEIPEEFFSTIAQERPDYVVLTGDYTEKRVYDEIVKRVGKISPRTKVIGVRGNMDSFKDLPLEAFIDLTGGWILGVIHGHQIYPRGDLHKLYSYAQERGRKILIHGHTHTFSVDIPYPNDILLVNPGTLTGARGGLQLGNPEKTFLELDIDVGKGVEVKERVIREKAEVIGIRRIRL